jgi:hypothetical protein
LEIAWLEHMSDPQWIDHPCDFGANGTRFGDDVATWIRESRNPKDANVFSSFTHHTHSNSSFIEPLAFLLRHPLSFCNERKEWRPVTRSKDWLVLAEKQMLHSHNSTDIQKKILIDAGASYYDSGFGGASTKWFVDEYRSRGIVFDAIYAWEAKKMDMERYWKQVPADVHKTMHLFNRPASIDSTLNNPLARLVSECRVEDFCVLKIDVDTPSVELPWVQQILQCHDVSSRIDEFFFEHHVHGLMENKYHEEFGWPSSGVSGTYADTYRLLAELRHRGIRAHSWV